MNKAKTNHEDTSLMEMNKETNGSKQSKKEDVVSQRPKRIVKRNRRFLDSDMWINSPSSASSPTASASMGSKVLPLASTSMSDIDKSAAGTDVLAPLSPATNGTSSDMPTAQQFSSGNGTSICIYPSTAAPEIVAKTIRGRKGKHFIRFRFQIDCVAAIEINVDALVNFLRNNMKMEGKKGNLSGVTIERHNSNVDIMSKVMLKKKYLKLLTKQYLKKKKQYNYRVATKNNRAYKLLPK